jgi:hypothetical protein
MANKREERAFIVLGAIVGVIFGTVLVAGLGRPEYGPLSDRQNLWMLLISGSGLLVARITPQDQFRLGYIIAFCVVFGLYVVIATLSLILRLGGP